MKTFNEHNTDIALCESFKNFVGPNSREGREKYADQVWDILQKSYAKIGGIAGSGFRNKQDMIDNIPFWKVFIKNQKVIVVTMYKDKTGRKAVAIGTDGSNDSRKVLASVFKDEISRSWLELSGGALSFMLKSVDPKVLLPYFKKPIQASKAMKKDVSTPNPDALDKMDLKLWNRYPNLHPFFYVRVIGGEEHLKISLGTTHKTIK